MLTNTIPQGKCSVRYLRTRCFCIRNLTRWLRSLVRFLIRQQLVRKYRRPALSMKYSLYILWITLLKQVINSYEAVFHIKSSNLPNSARNRFINLKEAIPMFYVKEVNKRNTWEIGQGINKIRNNYISGPFSLKKKTTKIKQNKQTNKIW